MRTAIALCLFAYTVAGLIGGIPAVLTLAGIGIAGTGLVLVADVIHVHVADRRALRIARARIFAHLCSECGQLHGGMR